MKFLSSIALCFLCAGCSSLPKNIVPKPRIVSITQEPHPSPIVMNVGDILMLQPFSVPVYPDYIACKLKITIIQEGLTEIGQLEMPQAGEGGYFLNAYLLSEKTGRYDVTVRLENRKGLTVLDYKEKYIVQVNP